MIKSLLFKEWLKMRWTFSIVSILLIVVIGYLYLSLTFQVRELGIKVILYNVIYNNFMFYDGLLAFFPLIAAVLLGLAQIIPEIQNNELKLTLNLPINQNLTLITFQLFGTLLLSIQFCVAYILLALICTCYFPIEVYYSLIFTSLPWFLAGFATYWAILMICIEMKWTTRLFLIIITTGFVYLFYHIESYNIYVESILIFIVLTLIFFVQIFRSAFRFRIGVF